MTETPSDALPHPDDSSLPAGTVDVLLIGGGIMSATLGVPPRAEDKFVWDYYD